MKDFFFRSTQHVEKRRMFADRLWEIRHRVSPRFGLSDSKTLAEPHNVRGFFTCLKSDLISTIELRWNQIWCNQRASELRGEFTDFKVWYCSRLNYSIIFVSPEHFLRYWEQKFFHVVYTLFCITLLIICNTFSLLASLSFEKEQYLDYQFLCQAPLLKLSHLIRQQTCFATEPEMI